MLSLPPAAADIFFLSSQQCFLAEPFLNSFHATAELSLQFPVVVQSRDPADAVMKAQIYSVQFCLLGVCRWSPRANILVFTEHVLSGGMGRTPLPAFPGFYVTSFLGLEPSSSDLQQAMSLLSILVYISL